MWWFAMICGSETTGERHRQRPATPGDRRPAGTQRESGRRPQRRCPVNTAITNVTRVDDPADTHSTPVAQLAAPPA